MDIEIYVLPNGRVGDARIVKSSGFERLDRSALDEASRNWRLMPATRDGVPFAQWYRLRVIFKLESAVSDCGAGAGLASCGRRAISGRRGGSGAERASGGRFWRHSRSTKNRLKAAMGTNIHGHL